MKDEKHTESHFLKGKHVHLMMYINLGLSVIALIIVVVAITTSHRNQLEILKFIKSS